VSGYTLNGGEAGLWYLEAEIAPPEALPAPARATRCELTLALDETIELLSLIDQPSYYSEIEA
jgi:hypothetical protein